LGRATLLAPVPSLVPLTLCAAGMIPAVQAILASGVLAAIAGAHVGYVRFELWRCRRLADRLLLAHPHGEIRSPLAARFVQWIGAIIRETERPTRLTWSPLNRAVVRDSLFLLRRLESRLSDLSRPVSPYGVLTVRELLADATTSPLYRPDRATDLPDSLTAALACLEAPR